jgi:flavin-dependent dehydrogenase
VSLREAPFQNGRPSRSRAMYRKNKLAKRFSKQQQGNTGQLLLESGARVAVVGGGPAGSLFAHFLSRMTDLIDIDLQVDVFEPRAFDQRGPCGCNHCGGIISESLVQMLATEGINLPGEVVQRGIQSYQLHMDVGSVKIQTPVEESRIAAVYRGNGPRCGGPCEQEGFDHFLQQMTMRDGATVHRKLVDSITVGKDKVSLKCADGFSGDYALLALAAGVNSNLVESVVPRQVVRRPASAVKTFICEFHLGAEKVEEYLGSSMHVFLLDLPRLQFAALIPKGAFATLCLLGDDIDQDLVERFLQSPELRDRFPTSVVPDKVCHCFPRINLSPAKKTYGDRVVLVGDCGVSRLYKDGIGAAYRTAKAAASTAVFSGIGDADFQRHYAPTCRAIVHDNLIGKSIFAVAHHIQASRLARSVIRRTVAKEQAQGGGRFSSVLWDVFTGSAPYKDIMLRSCHPAMMANLLGIFIGELGRSCLPQSKQGVR